MTRVYLAISYVDSPAFKELLDYIKEALLKVNVNLFVFVETYQFKIGEEEEMMQTAFKEIGNSDYLIAELSHKSIGAGIEMGYAYSKNKPIIYIRKTTAKTSSTAVGVAKTNIIYTNKEELAKALLLFFKQKK